MSLSKIVAVFFLSLTSPTITVMYLPVIQIFLHCVESVTTSTLKSINAFEFNVSTVLSYECFFSGRQKSAYVKSLLIDYHLINVCSICTLHLRVGKNSKKNNQKQKTKFIILKMVSHKPQELYYGYE